jgi:hypothetical protein
LQWTRGVTPKTNRPVENLFDRINSDSTLQTSSEGESATFQQCSQASRVSATGSLNLLDENLCDLIRLRKHEHVPSVDASNLAPRHRRELLLYRRWKQPVLLAHNIRAGCVSPAAVVDRASPVGGLRLHDRQPFVDVSDIVEQGVSDVFAERAASLRIVRLGTFESSSRADAVRTGQVTSEPSSSTSRS